MIEGATQTLIEKGVKPLVSVVLPVYNGEKYLAEAIDSVLAQTFGDFELIMIDDGSTDGSQQILREYERGDPRVRVIVRENRGLATTLNDSIDIARGSWIARMDQDDIALPHRFERQLEWLEKTGADIAGSWVRRFGTSDKRVVRLSQTDEAIKMEMLFCSPFAHPAVMMRAASVKLLRYDKAYEKAEDYDLWERAAEVGWKMTNVPEVLLLYRLHGAQISTITSMRQQQLTLQVQRRYWKYIFETMRLDQRWIDEVLNIRGSAAPMPNMDAADAALAGLLQRSHGESRDVIFNHATRLYIKVAASCPNIVSRWGKLNREFGEGWGGTTKFNLWLFRWLRIRADGDLFKQLKKLYVWRESR